MARTTCTSVIKVEVFALQCHMFGTMSRNDYNSVELMTWHRKSRLALLSHHKQTAEDTRITRMTKNPNWETINMQAALKKKP